MAVLKLGDRAVVRYHEKPAVLGEPGVVIEVRDNGVVRLQLDRPELATGHWFSCQGCVTMEEGAFAPVEDDDNVVIE